MNRTSHISHWLGWSAVVTVTAALLGTFASVLLRWPDDPFAGMAVGIACGAASGPIAFALGSAGRFAHQGRPVLVATVVGAGLIGLVGVLYLLVVVALGRRPAEDERAIVLLSLAATTLGCALVVPTGRRLLRWADEVVPGRRRPPEEMLSTFGGRLTRAVPMDELLLQLVELLHRNLGLVAAEIWTGQGGHLTRAVAIPERGRSEIQLGTDAEVAITNARALGNTWLEMWLPELLAGRDGQVVRSIPVRHLGELLGLIVLERPGDGAPFIAAEDRVLIDLARQLGLALHNVRLDSALQVTVDELRRRNVELAESRSRVVAAADESRRHIERDLHDGAQQSLVALGMKVGMAQAMLRSDPDSAASLVGELGTDIDSTIAELRELAHGVYPPRLRDGGLPEALRSAAARSQSPTKVVTDGIARHPADVEAAVYFCCLEALQNSTKHGGPNTTVTVEVTEDNSECGGESCRLTFTIADTGAGFDPEAVKIGQGMTNMRDRIGAIGGELSIASRPGAGTVVHGTVPAQPVAPG